MFGDEVMAAALIDRVLRHCHLVNIRGNSYWPFVGLCQMRPQVQRLLLAMGAMDVGVVGVVIG